MPPDPLVVLFARGDHGELIGNVKASETNENEVGLMMAGVHKGGTKSE